MTSMAVKRRIRQVVKLLGEVRGRGDEFLSPLTIVFEAPVANEEGSFAAQVRARCKYFSWTGSATGVDSLEALLRQPELLREFRLLKRAEGFEVHLGPDAHFWGSPPGGSHHDEFTYAPSVSVLGFELMGPDPGDPRASRDVAELREDAQAFARDCWEGSSCELLLAFSVAPKIGVFLVRFAHPLPAGDTERWLVVGDLPPIEVGTEYARTPSEALSWYCLAAQEWAEKALSGMDVSDCYPIVLAPTELNAELLFNRISIIRRDIIPYCREMVR